ncbi:BnaA06g32060D [Brassica napus]|uniref:(rape) hypothetical protein n=1 Tax=Brassica napus TaxID=3708 RepID=A0A078FL56_BRANA|nr:unnamed protein product [Brassica napus]CDY13717.1 BnaA06g32060D [Brassica napus]
MLLLSLNQYWQEELREEVFNECGNKIPDSDTFSRLKLMNMVLMESLRLYGPVTKMVREATQDIKIGHLDIPKGKGTHNNSILCGSKMVFLKRPITQTDSFPSQLDQELALPKTSP